MGNHHSQGNPSEVLPPQLSYPAMETRRPVSDSQLVVPPPPQQQQEREQHKPPLVRRTSSTRGYHPRSASLRRMRSIHRRRVIESSNPNKSRPPARRTARMEAESKKIQEQKHLLAACARGDISKVEMLVDNGVDVNSADQNQMTALHYAAMHSRDEVIQSLISRGAEVSTQDLKGGFTAMHWVVINAEPQCSSTNHQDKSLVTLVRAGCKINTTDFNFATPLHIAVQKGNKGGVQALMRLGADPDKVDITGRNCFEVAKSEQMKTLLRRLHDNRSPSHKDGPIYQVLEAPPPPFPAPLPPIPPPRLIMATKSSNSVEHIYNTPESSPPPSPSTRPTSVTPPPPRRRKQYVEYSKNNHMYHILEVPSPKHIPQRQAPRRRKVAARKQI